MNQTDKSALAFQCVIIEVYHQSIPVVNINIMAELKTGEQKKASEKIMEQS